MTQMTCAAAIAAIVAIAAGSAVAQTHGADVRTFRIRISVSGGEPDPAGGSALRYDEQVVGTISLSRNDDAGEVHYLGRRFTRRVRATYRGVTRPDDGDACAWLLQADGPAEVELRAVDENAWDLSIVANQKDAAVHTDKGSCPASQIEPDLPFTARVTTLEGPVPLDRQRVYRPFVDDAYYTLTLRVLDACEGTDFREGPDDARSESVREAVAGALNVGGGATGPEIVGIGASSILEFNVRLGPGHVPLPNRACLQERIDTGEIEEGTLIGAEHLLVGAVQESGGTTRVTVRTVDAATGEVVATGRGDAGGPDAIGSAMRQAIAQLGWGFGG